MFDVMETFQPPFDSVLILITIFFFDSIYFTFLFVKKKKFPSVEAAISVLARGLKVRNLQQRDDLCREIDLPNYGSIIHKAPAQQWKNHPLKNVQAYHEKHSCTVAF